MFHATTILCVNINGQVAMAGDGQVSMGHTVMKRNAVKIRRLGDKEKVVAGFAGSTADAFTLFEKFEGKLGEHRGNLKRAAVELAKEWRTDKFLRRLEALLIVADAKNIFTISGTGDVIEPDEPIAAIGSGGAYALAAARALKKFSKLNAKQVAQASLDIASEICIYTNDKIHIEELK